MTLTPWSVLATRFRTAEENEAARRLAHRVAADLHIHQALSELERVLRLRFATLLSLPSLIAGRVPSPLPFARGSPEADEPVELYELALDHDPDTASMTAVEISLDDEPL